MGSVSRTGMVYVTWPWPSVGMKPEKKALLALATFGTHGCSNVDDATEWF
jgi:hypothetical protein